MGAGLTTTSLHDTDFYTWTQEQAALLRAGKLTELDIANLIEEIEDMGRSERRELKNRLTVLLAHLLKWRYQPDRRGASWEATIATQRIEIEECLRDNPGLKSHTLDTLITAYRIARPQAMGETGLQLDNFPELCPWTMEQILSEEFWPE